MNKKTKKPKKPSKNKRLAAAEKNLRRIHKLIGPYEEKDKLIEPSPTRSKWRPGNDFAYLTQEFYARNQYEKVN